MGQTIAEEPDVVPCAYCRRPTTPDERAPGAGTWRWPGKGIVTNCLRCAGYKPCPSCGSLFDSAEGYEKCPVCELAEMAN